jgi:hypothetical protein
MSPSASPESQLISVNVQTGIRWLVLRDGPRVSAIKRQMKGGGASNPHATTYSLAKGYLSGRLTAKAALKAARRVCDPKKCHEVRQHLKNLIRMVPYVSGTARSLPPPSMRRGPEGLVEFKVAAQMFLEGGTDRYVGFWPNEIGLDYDSARLYAQLMREAVETSDQKQTIFVIYDLRRAKTFSFWVDDLDNDVNDLALFFEIIERDIKKAKLH